MEQVLYDSLKIQDGSDYSPLRSDFYPLSLSLLSSGAHAAFNRNESLRREQREKEETERIIIKKQGKTGRTTALKQIVHYGKI